MRTPRLRTPWIAVAIAAAIALGGCGDGGDETTTPAEGSQQSATTIRDNFSGGGERNGSSAKDTLDTSNLPEPQEGSKKAAPGVPVSKGGDNSIQTWGLEASAEEREQVTAIVQAFLDARADADWGKACAYLAADQRREFESLVRGGRRGNAACAEAMRALATGVPSSAFDDEAQIDYVLSLRVGDGHAFLIYTRTGENKIYATALGAEGGTWKVISVGPTVLS
jgi:hypothetical protein